MIASIDGKNANCTAAKNNWKQNIYISQTDSTFKH